VPRRSLITAIVFACSLACAQSAHAEKPRKPKPPLPAAQYPFHATHDSEHVTIAAEPCDTKDKLPDTRLDYLGHGFMPIRVIVTNDGDESILLDDARIHFLAADDTIIPAATTDDLERGIFRLKDATGTRLPLGIPIPITVGKSDDNKKILEDDEDFGFKTTTILPHTTVAGYLYYDIHLLDDPPLAHAFLELRKVKLATTNKYLDNFEIPLAPNPKSTDKSAR
jgi:hypothetical protein